MGCDAVSKLAIPCFTSPDLTGLSTQEYHWRVSAFLRTDCSVTDKRQFIIGVASLAGLPVEPGAVWRTPQRR